ncbi:hypothetical protein ACFYXS_19080 [Streptomyces sp. NPDC002574]|uniref:hypothetical protein n=1 Tax=Streptomyces sp. NPDC002574 TaxID=3364652 RepID=UPI0036A9D2AE
MILGMVFFLVVGTCLTVAHCVKRRWRIAALYALGLLCAELALAAHATGELWLTVAGTVVGLVGFGLQVVWSRRGDEGASRANRTE